jgi:hypothetical protein
MEEKVLLDWGAKIGAIAKAEGVEKHQLETLMASLESIRDNRECLLLTAAFAYRQSNRKERERPLLGIGTAERVRNALRELYEGGGTREDARKVLGIAKWVHEAAERLPRERLREVKSLKEFVDLLSRGEGRGVPEKGEKAEGSFARL